MYYLMLFVVLPIRLSRYQFNFIAHYALLGPYDFLDIYEATEEEAAARVSLIVLHSGAFQAESWVVIPCKRFVELAESIWDNR